MDLNRRQPFAGDYPNHRGTNRPLLGRAVQRQVADLTAQAVDAATRRQSFESAQQRRTDSGNVTTQVDILPTTSGFSTLIARGEVLVNRTAYEQARDIFDSFGMVEVPVGHDRLAQQLVRLRNPALSGAAIAGLVKSFPPASMAPNHVVPLAPVGKGLGGPAPDSGLGPFADYPVHKDGPGDRVKVGVIDTGIAAELRTDGWLLDIDRMRPASVDPLDVLPADGLLDRMAGHGTFVSGVVQQVAPGSEIVMYRALDTDGLGTEIDVALALLAAVDSGCQVVNMSVGCQTVDDTEPAAFKAAFDLIEQDKGDTVVIVAAAGNYGNDTRVWPAARQSVVSVAALDPDMQPAAWSSRGSWVTCSTVGRGLLSTYVQGTEAPEGNPAPDVFLANAWGRWSGTSFAAPQISGAVAQACRRAGLQPRAAINAILEQGTEIVDFGSSLEILAGM
jgi:hypothetical protein